MVRCIDCVKLEKCAKTNGKPQIVEVVPGCENGQRKPVTNGDKIRAKSDKELAEWLVVVETAILEKQSKLDRSALKDDWLDWLKQEATT